MISPMKLRSHSRSGRGEEEEEEDDDDDEEEEEIIQFEEDDMTLAQFSKSRQTTSPKPIKEVVVDQVNKSDKSRSCKKRVFSDDSDDAMASTLKRAKEIQMSLDPNFPSFVKLMHRSFVCSWFQMGLPTSFANEHMPEHEETMTFIDENGVESIVKYISSKGAFSGGWKVFCITKKLVEGDSLVFHLIEPTKFKVYVVRAHGWSEADGEGNHLQLDEVIPSNSAGKYVKSARKELAEVPHLENKKQKTSSPPGPSLGLPAGEHSRDGNAEVEDSKGIRFSASIESFTIMVDGLMIDSEIPDDVRAKYFDLCCTQNDFLHKSLFEGYDPKFVAGIITEIVGIADAIRASKLSTPPKEYNKWLETLKAFELLGMSVGFIRARLEQLIELAVVSKEGMESRKYRKAIRERARLEDNIRTCEKEIEDHISILEEHIVEFKNESYKLEMEIETLKEKAEKHELKFQAEVNAPW